LEAVIVLPVFLSVIFIILQAALWIQATSIAQAAALDGVRTSSSYGANNDEGRQLAYEILARRSVGHDWVVTVYEFDRHVEIQVAGYATSVIPGWNWEVNTSAILPKEVTYR
jgi:hypothetical protein